MCCARLLKSQLQTQEDLLLRKWIEPGDGFDMSKTAFSLAWSVISTDSFHWQAPTLHLNLLILETVLSRGSAACSMEEEVGKCCSISGALVL